MRRVKSACIIQTIQFLPKDGLNGVYEKRRHVKAEVERFKERMKRDRIKFKIISEESQEDESIIVELIREYENKSIGNYLD